VSSPSAFSISAAMVADVAVVLPSRYFKIFMMGAFSDR
jgi:hypothetical protein